MEQRCAGHDYGPVRYVAITVVRVCGDGGVRSNKSGEVRIILVIGVSIGLIVILLYTFYARNASRQNGDRDEFEGLGRCCFV